LPHPTTRGKPATLPENIMSQLRRDAAAHVVKNRVSSQLAATSGETNHFRMVFGPTNVALHRVSTAVELGRTAEALKMAERVAVHNAPAVERRLTFHLDAARCYARQKNDVAAVHMLQRIHRESPEELRHSSLVRETLRQLKGRATPAVEPDLRPLLAAASVPD